jgi:hypothetical protein
VGVWWMSIKDSVLLGALAVGGISALFALVPGSPVLQILNQPVVIAIASDDSAERAVDPEPPPVPSRSSSYSHEMASLQFQRTL